MAMGSTLVLRTVDALAEGSANPTPQMESGVLHPAPKITRETCKIEWNDTAVNITNRVRGLSPYPAAYAVMAAGDKKSDVKIFCGEAVEMEKGHCDTGAIVSDGKTRLCVKCAEGLFEITELQMAGKKRLKAREFLVGVHNIENYRFE
jgi:methionyl-tRNA formyltransferase